MRMPSLILKKSRISQALLNADVLENGENKLKLNFSFSTMLPNGENPKSEGRVRIDLETTTECNNLFLKIIYDAILSFESEELDATKKMDLLEKEGTPITYKCFCEYLNKFIEVNQLKKIILPQYSELKNM